MEDVPLEKIGISGPILASILERFSSCQGDVDGLLFGEISEAAPSNLLDDDDDHLPNSTLVANITGFFCSGTLFSFYDPLGRLDVAALQRSLGDHRHLIGWFLGRRRTPLRPSMRESAVTASLNKTPTLNSSQFPPSVFLLLSTPLSHQLIHTHEYKAFQFRHSTRLFEPKTLDVINIGPAFRGHYGAFTPNSPFPLLRPKEKKKAPVDEEKETLVSLKRTAKDQQGLDLCAQGFEVARLNKLMGKDAANYTSDLEDLYAKMLAKLEGLARLVEKTSAMVNDQEHRNMKLRNKFSGLE